MHKIFINLLNILKLFMRAGKVLNTVTRVNNTTQEWVADSRKVGSTLLTTTNKVNDLSAQVLELQNADKVKTDKLNKLSAKVTAQQKYNKKVLQRINVLTDMMGALLDKIKQVEEIEFSTSQENVWRTDHGFKYVVHHMSEDWKTTRLPYWELFLSSVPEISSICEFGCNIGANLKAINELRPEIALTGVEINSHAVDEIRKQEIGDIHCDSILEVNLEKKYDFVFTRGVLIHINPQELNKVLHNMAKHSKRYVMIYEHYSPQLFTKPNYNPQSKAVVQGEGYQFWNDFCGEFHALYPDWEKVNDGVNLKPRKKPERGDLYWAIFKRPDAS